MIGRLAPSVVLATAALLAIAAPAAAHIDPDPDEAQAGSRLTVGFTVEHGCEGSPTTQLDMRLPAGALDAVPEPAEGWEGSVATVDDDTIVTFAGGPLPDDEEGTFEVTMTLPPTPDVTVYFPFVQRCEVGEIRWIGIPAEPGDELDEPAPAMRLVGPVASVPPSETTVPESVAPTQPTTTEPAATDAPTTSTVPSATSSDPEEVADTTEPAVTAETVDESGNSGTGTIVFIASVAAVLGLGAFVTYRARQTRAAGTD